MDLEVDSFRTSYDDMVYEPEKENGSQGSLSPFTFICLLLVISLMGLTVLYSSSYDIAIKKDLEHYAIALLSAIGALAGIAIGIPFRYAGKSILYKASYVLVPASFAISAYQIAASSPIALNGMRIASAESVLVFTLCFFLPLLANEEKRRIKVIILCLILMLMLLAGGTGCFTIGVAIAFAAFSILGIPRIYSACLILFSSAIAIASVFAVPSVSEAVFTSFLPVSDPSLFDAGIYSTLQAVRDGGFLGVGLGHGLFKLGGIEGIESEYILCSIAEELGIFGIIAITILFALLFFVGYRSASRSLASGDRMGGVLTISLSFSVFLRLVLYILHSLALFPSEGMLMPFFSFGPGDEALNMVSMIIVYRFIHETGRGMDAKAI